MKFTKQFKFTALISVVIIIAGLIVGLVSGVNIGVDFSGGTLFTIDMGAEYDVADVNAALSAAGIENATVMKSGTSGTDRTQAVIRVKAFADDVAENEARSVVMEELQKTYPEAEVANIDRVGAVASAELIKNALMSVAIAAVLILIYIWIRFDLMSGISAVIMLIHDVLIMISFTIILQIQVNSPFVAAVLTIVGYSINNTIVIFDRVRENGKFGGKRAVLTDDLVDNSIRETLTRTINTSLTTLITIVVLYIMGVDSIKEFCLPIIVGLLAGTYSSVLLAAPFWGRLTRLKKAR